MKSRKRVPVILNSVRCCGVHILLCVLLCVVSVVMVWFD
jgi:hypothetical protein